MKIDSDFHLNRENYLYFSKIATRWMDNDVYGHVNNVIYYSFFDTVANNFLMENGVIDFDKSPIVGLIVASSCNYRSPVAHPSTIDAGFRVNRIGNTSVEYGCAIFPSGEKTAAAHGTYTHAFVDRDTHSPKPLSEELRAIFNSVLVSSE